MQAPQHPDPGDPAAVVLPPPILPPAPSPPVHDQRATTPVGSSPIQQHFVQSLAVAQEQSSLPAPPPQPQQQQQQSPLQHQNGVQQLQPVYALPYVPPKPAAAVGKAAPVIVVLVTVIVLLLALLVGRSLVGLGSKNAWDDEPPIRYPLAGVIPIYECIKLTPEQIKSGVAQFGDTIIRISDVRASLRYYMQKNNMSAVCAQMLDHHKICYAILNIAENRDAGEKVLVDMYNMYVSAESEGDRYRTTEKIIPFCEKELTKMRYFSVSVRYLNEKGVRMVRDLEGDASILAQQIDEIQSGEAYCMDTNAEARRERLERRVREKHPPPPLHSPSPSPSRRALPN